MSDIDIFDPAAFFAQRIKELEQEIIAKQARTEILQANRQNLEKTLRLLNTLPEAQQRALQMEATSLIEARESTIRTLETLQFEMESLRGKLVALKSARVLLEQGPGPGEREAAAAEEPPKPQSAREAGKPGGEA